MLSSNLARDKVAQLVETARKLGADAADAAYVGDRSTSVGVRAASPSRACRSGLRSKKRRVSKHIVVLRSRKMSDSSWGS